MERLAKSNAEVIASLDRNREKTTEDFERILKEGLSEIKQVVKKVQDRQDEIWAAVKQFRDGAVSNSGACGGSI